MKHYLIKAIRLSNYLSWGGIVCRSAELPLLCPFMSLYLSLSLRHNVCSNDWQSGNVVLIYCMVAQIELVWNVSVIGVSLRQKHLWCLGTTNCSIRNRFMPESSVHLTHTAHTWSRTHFYRYTVKCASTQYRTCTLLWQSFVVIHTHLHMNRLGLNGLKLGAHITPVSLLQIKPPTKTIVKQSLLHSLRNTQIPVHNSTMPVPCQTYTHTTWSTTGQGALFTKCWSSVVSVSAFCPCLGQKEESC